MKEIIYLGVFLAVVSAIAAGLLAGTYLITTAKIGEQTAAELQASLKAIIPEAERFTEENTGFFIGYRGTIEAGTCQKVAAKGYAGNIDLLVGINNQGKVTGVKILKINETPGLGQNATEIKFLEQFIGKTRDDKLKAKEDIQAITGATITSQAVSDGVKKALEFSRQHPGF